jgi:hypothetical protein
MMRALKIGGGLVAALVVLSCIGTSGVMWIIEVPWQLATGWLWFIGRVVPEVTVRPAGVVEAVLILAVLGVGLHRFMRWLWPLLRAQEQDTPPWPVRWSVSILSMLVLSFLATMATVGIGHHVGWLATGRAPLLEKSWGFDFGMSREASNLCREALSLSKGGVAEADISSALLANAETRSLMEALTVLPMRKPGSDVAFVVIPRDPMSLQQSGMVRCGGSVPINQKEHLSPNVLPRLLAGEEVAGEITY